MIREIRADAPTASCICIALSADATEVMQETAKAAGVSEYLTRPLDVERFLALIDRLLRSAG